MWINFPTSFALTFKFIPKLNEYIVWSKLACECLIKLLAPSKLSYD